MKTFKYILTALACACVIPFTSCKESDPITYPPVNHDPIVIERGTFAKGADVSWITQLEKEGYKFYNQQQAEKECMQLLRDDCGVNSIRLRVWVNPEEGWCNIHDVVVKARRANSLGLRVMIDFHFSDTWADPGNQAIPAAWEGKSLDEVKALMAAHVTDLFSQLKALDIEPEWVQIGNETSPGMLLPMGSIDEHPDQYAALNNAAYDAAKAVFPDVKCIIHLDGGEDQWRFNRMFDAMATYGGKYDMIGMSVYPSWAGKDWDVIAKEVIANIKHVKQKYGKPVMICEIGMPYDQPDDCRKLIVEMMNAETEGVFYWEPEAPAERGYGLGCFDNNMPTSALDAFKLLK
ncbi:MAG: glycosyl hydrolase 53 family protein [Muribaculaceae bacterium]|nr:glycosyl hydrolase 53 family protein [Muribaculaceae bacterium]